MRNCSKLRSTGMTGRIGFLVTVFLFLIAACSPQVAPTVTVAPISGAPTPILASPSAGSFDSARALEHNRKLAVDFGKRVAGTPGGQSAADYIGNEFKKSGLTVTR